MSRMCRYVPALAGLVLLAGCGLGASPQSVAQLPPVPPQPTGTELAADNCFSAINDPFMNMMAEYRSTGSISSDQENAFEANHTDGTPIWLVFQWMTLQLGPITEHQTSTLDVTDGIMARCKQVAAGEPVSTN